MVRGTIETHWLVYIFPWWQPELTREAYITLMCHVALCIVVCGIFMLPVEL